MNTGQLDPVKYQGVWYEIARYPNWFENDCVSAKAIYQWTGKQMNVRNVCTMTNGATRDISGIATIPNSQYPWQLLVDFHMGFPGQYWVLWTDYDKWALVGDGMGTSFWILSRTPQISYPDYQLLTAYAQQLGYNGDLIINPGAVTGY